MGRIGLLLAVLALAVLVLAPVVTMTTASLRVDRVVMDDGTVLMGDIRSRGPETTLLRVRGETMTRELENGHIASIGPAWSLLRYQGIFSRPEQINMLTATLALAGASALLAALLGLPVGLVLATVALPGRRLLETLAVLPLVLPPILLAIATYHDLVHFEPSFLRAVIVFGLCLWPLVSLFVARAVRATGTEALEAARLQTTGPDALLRVALGPALPGMAAGALLAFVFVVGDFAVPDFLGVTTAKNTIIVYANAVFRYWSNDADAGNASAAGMPATLIALVAFAAVLIVEDRRRAAQTVTGEFREIEPLHVGRWRWVWLGTIVVVLLLSLVWPLARHLETASGAHFGTEVFRGGANPPSVPADSARGRPAGLLDGLRMSVRHPRVADAALHSLWLAGGGALIAVLLALLITEVGRGRPRLDKVLLVVAFLPLAVPPMSFAVGWVTFYGAGFSSRPLAPILLLGARLLPFAVFAVRAARSRIADELIEAGAVAGLPPAARTRRVVLPLMVPGAALGALLAFLFGLREVDSIVFTRSGAETLPVQLYNMIHYGFDVQVAGLSVIWTLGVGLFIGLIGLLVGRRFRLLP